MNLAPSAIRVPNRTIFANKHSGFRNPLHCNDLRIQRILFSTLHILVRHSLILSCIGNATHTQAENTMYTVSILTSRNGWRTITTSTLSEAVQLTHGLSTQWQVTTTNSLDYCSYNYTSSVVGKKYKHALRSLVARWKSKSYDNVACYRMSDTQLLAYQNSIESRTR